MTDSSELIVILTSFPDETSAMRCAQTLVEERLVACAQVAEAPIRSIYHWEGQVRQERETLVTLKTSVARWPRIKTRLTDLHPYDVPELVALQASATQAYGAWLHRGCSDTKPTGPEG
jgi:periplasmic divalent cation tolerance protein